MARLQTTALEVRGLGKQKTQKLAARARRLGMTPQRYLKHLVEEDLAISDRAKSTSFEDLLGPGRDVDEAELDRLVVLSSSASNRVAPKLAVRKLIREASLALPDQSRDFLAIFIAAPGEIDNDDLILAKFRR